MTRKPTSNKHRPSESMARGRDGRRVSEEPPQPFRRETAVRSSTSATSRHNAPRTTAADSRRMAGIRQRDTRAEVEVRRVLRELGVRYRVNVKTLPGRPDVANATRRLAVFVHGCFWHRHPGCRRTTTPTRNRDFWLDKFAANVQRDRRSEDALRALGYRVAVIWECETEDSVGLATRLRERLALDSDEENR